MKTAKINRQKIYEIIAEHIKQQILSGELEPGEKLPTSKELCDIFQVGRSTVREALSALEIMGLIETRQGEGSTVKIYNTEDVKLLDFKNILISEETVLELMEARKSIEITNARMAALKRTEEDLIKLKNNLEMMELNITNAMKSKKADMQFHQILAESTHNSIMVRLIATMSDQMSKAMEEIRRITFDSPALSRRVFEEHYRIYQAVAAQDRLLAQQRMLEHLDHFENEMRNYYKSKK
ncbi:MAG TPA: FadR family transcriptional regulator [Bacillales bacterium]|nr:FadR family transcriptional regulator [Bacillales bacterium]